MDKFFAAFLLVLRDVLDLCIQDMGEVISPSDCQKFIDLFNHLVAEKVPGYGNNTGLWLTGQRFLELSLSWTTYKWSLAFIIQHPPCEELEGMRRAYFEE